MYSSKRKKFPNLSDKMLQIMRNKFKYALDEVEAGRWIKYHIFDKHTESHDMLGLFTHTREFTIDDEDEECIALVYRVLESRGYKARVSEFRDEADFYDWKKAVIAWNDFVATQDDVEDILDVCLQLVDAELRKRNIVFAS